MKIFISKKGGVKIVDIYEILKEPRKTGDYVPIRFDPVMKKIWGDVNNPERSAFLLSKILDLPYELIVNHLEIIESEKRKKNIKEQGSRNDIVIKLSIPQSELMKVNIEMNNRLKYSKTIQIAI